MGKKLWEDLQVLRTGEPGRRFQQFRRQRRARRGNGFSQGLTLAIGVLLILGGLAIGWLPGPGGFIAIIGLAVIVQVSPVAARMLDAFELFIRRVWRSAKSLVSESRPGSPSKGYKKG